MLKRRLLLRRQRCCCCRCVPLPSLPPPPSHVRLFPSPSLPCCTSFFFWEPNRETSTGRHKPTTTRKPQAEPARTDAHKPAAHTDNQQTDAPPEQTPTSQPHTKTTSKQTPTEQHKCSSDTTGVFDPLRQLYLSCRLRKYRESLPLSFWKVDSRSLLLANFDSMLSFSFCSAPYNAETDCSCSFTLHSSPCSRSASNFDEFAVVRCAAGPGPRHKEEATLR